MRILFSKQDINHETEVCYLKIHEVEGKSPTVTVITNIEDTNKFKVSEDVKVTFINDQNESKILFQGKIKTSIPSGRKYEITAETEAENFLTDLPLERNVFFDTEESSQMSLILRNNQIPFIDRKNKSISTVSAIKAHSIKDVSNLILYDSLSYEQNNSAVSEVNLELSASWISREEGIIDITNNILSKFEMGKINTFTPKTLVESWPKFGEKITNHSFSNQSKYFFGPCHIKEESQYYKTGEYRKSIYPIKISEFLPECRIKKTWMDGVINICFGFDQYRKEFIRTTVKNTSISMGIKKKISFNLRNIQDNLESNKIQSFFETSEGKEAFKYALDIVGSYMLFSMRNTIIKFMLPLKEDLLDLNVSNWIQINGLVAKITEIKIVASFEEQYIKVTAASFCGSNEYIPSEDFEKTRNGMLFKYFKPKEPKNITASDVIYDIFIENEANTQFHKLVEELRLLDKSKKITKSNLKSTIQRILSINRTKIQIITNPLKTETCEKHTIDLGQSYFVKGE